MSQHDLGARGVLVDHAHEFQVPHPILDDLENGTSTPATEVRLGGHALLANGHRRLQPEHHTDVSVGAAVYLACKPYEAELDLAWPLLAIGTWETTKKNERTLFRRHGWPL